MQDTPPRYWFAAKRVGWGWSLPLTWQGWVVFAVYLAAVAGTLAWLPLAAHPLTGGALLALATLALLLICWRKGEPLG